jgi:hypothetical protein
MRLDLNALSTILPSFVSRKVQSSSRNTHLPNIFARRDSHTAARLAARHHAAKSAGRIRNGHNTGTGWRSTNPVHGPNAHNNDRAGQRPRGPKPLQRYNDVLVPPPPWQPQLPGAYDFRPSITLPNFTATDSPHWPALIQDHIFLEALYAGRQVLLRAAHERREKAKAQKQKEDAEYARLLQQDMYKAREAHRQAEDAEYARLLQEDLKKARAAQRRAEEEEFARLLEEERRKAQEAQRQAEAREAERKERERLEEEERRRRAEQEESRAKARREREYLFQKAMAETAQRHLVERLRTYEETWAALRSNDAGGMGPLGFCDIPWPVFGNVRSGRDVTEERVKEFVCHPVQEYVRNLSGGQAKSLRSEMLRWHPDKFEGKVLDRVVEADRDAVKETAGYVARILTQLSAGMR